VSTVVAKIEPLTLPTYPVGAPERNPVFFEKRVYQGSSGKVYPVPFIDKVRDHAEPRTYQSARLENEFIRLVMLPEIGGRIYLGQDKANHDYDFFYRNEVIKPALVGLAGPWLSGGVEFNWPQHHRPGTFMPTDVCIEEEPDGAKTIWMSEHDPIDRMKGMHGIRLRPGSSLIELRVRLYNRTPLTQTFLWWTNIAAAAHELYQSFFPDDVHYVADHAVRALSSFPEAWNQYYGVEYAARPGRNDLSWYKNIPVPTSYMVCQTRYDFFGGYDHAKRGGFINVANRHIAPGKKQWTWGNHEFGWAWDRELTDRNGPYVELMAGVYTDNQPDFSYLAPFETRTFSQFWWPFQQIGPAQQASERAALRLVVREDRTIECAVCASERIEGAKVTLTLRGSPIIAETVDLMPGKPWMRGDLRFAGTSATELELQLFDSASRLLLAYRPVDRSTLTRDRPAATEPAAPAEVTSADELFLIGEHLEQYRHPTRSPEPYWEEAVRRDPGDARCNLALGRRALRRGQLDEAGQHFVRAISRLTKQHPNPATGEAHYYAGLAAFYRGELDQAYNWLYKATWNYAWRSPAFYQLACIDCQRGNIKDALLHLEQSLATNQDHHKAGTLSAALHRQQGNLQAAKAILENILRQDPLDHWARFELSRLEGSFTAFLAITRNDAQTILDLVFDYADAGLIEAASELLDLHHASPVLETAVPNPSERSPMTRYALAWLRQDSALLPQAPDPDRFFPSRLHEQLVLEWTLKVKPDDPVAAYALGNYLFNLRRHEEAIAAWELSVSSGADWATVHRNLGIGYWNTRRDADAARRAYAQAIILDPGDARLVSERDQLAAKLNEPLIDRLAFLEERASLVAQRDDCMVALASLYNLLGRPQEALELITSRAFHPWEGGEGAVLAQYTAARLLLGKQALAAGEAEAAFDHFSRAMDTPESLGEAYHLLQAKADVNFWTAQALRLLGRHEEAHEKFAEAASEIGDFAEMAVTTYSPLTYFRGLALRELGREEEARTLFGELKAFSEAQLNEKAAIPFFATSLPNLLVFDEDLQLRREAEHHQLIALACHGLGNEAEARQHLSKSAAINRALPHAVELARALSSIETLA
jgi:tetratricopeptide (TPR) repeat protein